tara:strand:+ start:199 stop:591 length:393 start_codon:yes stop_codon:yes gene_type:complete
MMLLLLVCLILVLSISIVVYPIVFSGTSVTHPDDTIEGAESLRRQRERIYEELKIIQQEYFLNHLPHSAYVEQRDTLRERAALYLYKESIAEEASDDLEISIEEQLEHLLYADEAEPKDSTGEGSQEHPA